MYRRTAPGVWRRLAAVTPTAFDPAFPGGGASGGDEDGAGRRHYVVSAVSAGGVEGPWSVEVTAGPP